jgi:hypothetical protein
VRVGPFDDRAAAGKAAERLKTPGEARQRRHPIVTWLDFAVAGVLLFCVLFGLWRGLVREVVSVLGWVIAVLAANLFAGPLGQALPAEIPTPELRLATAFVAIFVCSLIVTTLIGLLLSKMVKAVGWKASIARSVRCSAPPAC